MAQDFPKLCTAHMSLSASVGVRLGTSILRLALRGKETTAMKTTAKLRFCPANTMTKKTATGREAEDRKGDLRPRTVNDILSAPPRGSPQTLFERVSCNHSRRWLIPLWRRTIHKSILAADSSSWEKTFPAGRMSHLAFCSAPFWSHVFFNLLRTEDMQQTNGARRLRLKSHTRSLYPTL